MGIFNFKWPHEAEEVYVTGTFDNWSKSEQLEKVGDHFEKTVTLPETSESILYKFVVDGNWTTDHTAPQAKDSEGNVNNLLKPEDITTDSSPAAATMTTVAPESTTADLAKSVPLEHKQEVETPTVLNTVAPESTTAELVKAVPLEVVPVEEEKKQVVPVKEVKEEAPVEDKQDAPLEQKETTASSDLPGAFPATPADDLDKQFSVNPLPATEGALNPVKLEPGSKIPESITATNGVHTNVTLDKESYEKSDRIPGIETELPPVTNNMIPESSLPIIGSDIAVGNVAINSVAPESSTAALAAQAPLEPRVPEVVKESQEKADVAPEASGQTEAVEEKAQVEDELLAKVAEAPSTSEGTAGKGTEKSETDKTTAEQVVDGVVDGAIAAGETLLGAAIVAGSVAVAAGHKIMEKGQPVAEQAASTGTAATISAKETIAERSQTAAQQATETATTAKDTIVEGSQNAAQQATGAATAAKDTIVATAYSAGQTATTTAAGVASHLPESVQQVLPVSVQEAIHATPTDQLNAPGISPLVPAEVKDSIDESGQGPEAAANTAAVLQKTEVEAELLKEVNKSDTEEVSSSVPTEVKESIAKAGDAPEAAANASAVEHKTEVEAELLDSVKPVKSIDEQPKQESTSTAAPQAVEPPSAPVAVPEVSKPAEPISEPVPATAVEALDQPTLKVAALQSGELTPGPSTTVDPIAEPVRESAVEAVNQTAPVTEAVNTEQPTTSEPAPTSAQPSEVNGAESTLAAPVKESHPHTPTKSAAPVGEKTTTPSSSKTDSHSTAEKKKKNRLSSFFSKLKGKVAHQDKP